MARKSKSSKLRSPIQEYPVAASAFNWLLALLASTLIFFSLHRPLLDRPHQPDNCEEFHTLFPYRLHQALSLVEHLRKTHIVSWLPCGSKFQVYNTDAFAREVMPSIGRFRRYKSFLRQLCMYKFEKIPSGPFKGAFSHPYFRRDHASLCRAVLRGEMYALPDSSMEKIKQKREIQVITPGDTSSAASSGSRCNTKSVVSRGSSKDLKSMASSTSRLSMEAAGVESSWKPPHSIAKEYTNSRFDEIRPPGFPREVSIPLTPQVQELSLCSPDTNLSWPSRQDGRSYSDNVGAFQCDDLVVPKGTLTAKTQARSDHASFSADGAVSNSYARAGEQDYVIDLEPRSLSPPNDRMVDPWPIIRHAPELCVPLDVEDEIIATFSAS